MAERVRTGCGVFEMKGLCSGFLKKVLRCLIETTGILTTWELGFPHDDKPGGLNGSSQHLDELPSPGIPKAKNVREHKCKEKASCLGKNERQPRKTIPLQPIIKPDDRMGVASTS